jgi:hypothetical protein
MSEVATTPEVDMQWPEPPRLLVEWSSRWDEFKSALRPALARSPKALAGEAPIGIFPYRGMLACWLLECLLLIAIIVLPARYASLQVPAPPVRLQWDVIYYSADELPQTQDRGGAEAGKSGRAGGQQAHHRTQTIRVARGDKPTEKVVDAPKINLPHSDSAVANLLAVKANPGPPPAEGLRSALKAPILPALSPVAPTPELNASARHTANALATNIVPPAPEVSHASTRTSSALSASVINTIVIPPAPNVSRDKMPTSTPLAPTVIAPAPRDAQRDLASSRVPLAQTADVVAPPVSAPARDVSSTSKMALPAPAVIAPPPSQVSRDLNSWGSSNTGDLRAKPVPPPPTASGGGALARSGAASLTPQVVPPPASIGGAGSQRGNGGERSGNSVGSLLGSANVVPPPPSLGGGKGLSGSGRGNKGAGAGGPLDLGSSVAPPSNTGGNAAGNGVVMSNKPGTKVGLPNSTGGGALAMSPSGSAKTGLGGSGGGAGIGKGNGPGSGLQGEGSGAGKEGTGRGSDPNARGGISPYPGAGGAGSGTSGTPAVPGVSVEGGTTTVNLPSFGSSGDASATGPGRSSTRAHGGPSYTVKATSSSGGVFNRYGQLKGDNYSIYIETSLGTAVMQFADVSSAAHPDSGDLTKPEPIRDELPHGLRPTYVVFACILDRSGNLKDVKVLEPGAAETTSRILVALREWKFRPAFRGNEPVEVNAFLGFGIDTR